MGLENFWHPKVKNKRDLREGIAEFHDEICLEEREQIPTSLVATEEIFDIHGVSLEEIYEWYASAISRREREPLELERFVGHFIRNSFDPTFAFGDPEKGFVLGFLKYGVFVPTHFAPKTIRGGYDLMRRLGESESVPAVLAITHDLATTLSKMPSWHILDIGFLALLRQGLVGKKFAYNSHPDTRNLMAGLVAEYLGEANKV